MKIFLSIILLTLLIFAVNMSLGPYNKEDFLTQEEQLKQKKLQDEAKKRKEQETLEAYEIRMQFLREKAKEQEQERRRRALKLKQQEEQRKRNAAVRAQIEENLRQAREEEAAKRLYTKERSLTQEHHQEIPRKTPNDFNVTLVPQQKELFNNNPDDIVTEINNINRLRYLLLKSDRTPESVKDYIRFLNALKKDYDIDFLFSYRAIVQAELDSSTRGSGGKYDLSLRYVPRPATTLALKFDGFHQYGTYSSSEFINQFGALSSTSASYRDESLYLSQIWWQESISNFLFRAGKIDASSFIDSHDYKSDSRFFFSSNFSSSPYNAFPQNGLGIAGKYTKEHFYVTAEVTDANAVADEMSSSFFNKREYYKAVEFGITPADGSKYHISFWDRDNTDDEGDNSKHGVIGSFVQAMDKNTKLILRGAVSDHATAKHYASIGLGRTSLFQENDICGLALGMLAPDDQDDDTTERTQTTLESFYRIDPLPGIQLSADMQIIYHPSLHDQTWAILPGLRLRVVF